MVNYGTNILSNDEQQAADQEVEDIRKTLFQHVTADEPNKVKDIIQKLISKGMAMSQIGLREPGSKRTALHLALDTKAHKAAECIVKYGEKELFVQDYNITVKGETSKKTCLHQLTEINDYEMIQSILDSFDNETERLVFMMKSVLMEVEGSSPRKFTCLHIAAFRQYIDLIKLFVEMGVDVDIFSDKNGSPLLWSAGLGKLDSARTLMGLGASLSAVNEKGSCPLHCAVRYGHTDMTKLLIEEGHADVNARRVLGFEVVLILASALGYIDIVKILLMNSANICYKTASGDTALHHAASEGNCEIMLLLIKCGASIEQRTDLGDTPLLLAAKNNQLGAIKILLDFGADFTFANEHGETVWHHAVNATSTDLIITLVCCFMDKEFPWRHPVRVKSPLHLAAMRGDCEMVDCLLKLGLDPMEEDEAGNTFYHLAARNNEVKVLTDFVEVMNVDAQNIHKDTALHEAAREGHIESVQFLVKTVNLHVKNHSGNTVLHAASNSKSVSPDVLKLIIHTIVETTTYSLVNERNYQDCTALHLAARAGRNDIIKYLKPINPRIKNDMGDNALHVAAR